MKAKGCLIAVAVVLVLGALALTLVGPTLLREGERVYRPIAKLQGAQHEFEAWSEAHPFKAPAEVSLSEDQLIRFLKLRARLDEVAEQNPLPVEGMRRNQRPKLAEIQGVLEGVGGNVTGRMDAYRAFDMPPGEYRYLERVVYRQWLRPLRADGRDPAAVGRAAQELRRLADGERSEVVARRVRELADQLSAGRVPSPEGFPPDVHALLLLHAIEIDALVEVGAGSPDDPGSRIDF